LVAGLVEVATIGGGIQDPLLVLGTMLLLSPIWLVVLGGLLLLHSWLDKRAARQGGLDGQRAVPRVTR
jgi:hypothetical protein